MITFALAVFFLIVTPGPGVLSTAGVGSGFGARAGSRYVLGLFFGTNIVALSVVTGVAAVLIADPRIRVVLQVLSMAYLAYLAFRIAFAGSRISFVTRTQPPGILGGIALQIVNPKAYVVNTALFTGFPFWPEAIFAEILMKFAIVNLIWVPIHFLWLWAGISLHRLELGPRAQFSVNIAMAASMILVVVLALVGFR